MGFSSNLNAGDLSKDHEECLVLAEDCPTVRLSSLEGTGRPRTTLSGCSITDYSNAKVKA